jgi:hypothetical protein
MVRGAALALLAAFLSGWVLVLVLVFGSSVEGSKA